MQAHPSVGICGSHIHLADGTPHASAFRFPSILSELERGLRFGAATRLLRRWVVPIAPSYDTFEVDWVSGASLMIRRKTLEDIGFFDEGYFLYYEETDLCLRAKREGWTSWYVGTSSVGHIGGAATGTRDASVSPHWYDSRQRYFEKNHGLLYRAAADAVFALSFSMWRARRRLQNEPDRDPPGILREFLRHSLRGASKPRSGGSGGS